MKVSIIVPIYNVKEFLAECVESLINQDYKNIEVLLIDDGSTDGSSQLCDELTLKDQRIKVVHKENGRTHSARNLGVSIATGEYVMFIDPDDWFDLDCVSTLVGEIEEHNLDVARFNYVREFGNHSVKKENNILENKVYVGKEIIEVLRKTVGLTGSELAHPENMNFLASVCFNIYRKSIFTEYNLEFFDIKKYGGFVDGYFNITYFLHVNRFKFIDKCFYHYRKTNSASASAKYKENFSERQLMLFNEIKELILENKLDEELEMAINNRIELGVIEFCLNAIRNSNKKNRYKEVKLILKNASVKAAVKNLNIKSLPLKWKVFYISVKMRFTLGVYWLAKIMDYLKKRV